MKLRYFLTSVFACLALAIGCTQEELPGLSEIQVTPSYFTFGVDGGAKTLTVTAADAWTVTDVPEWLNVSPAKGDAGAEIKVTVTAAATDQEKIRTATVKFNCAGVSQLVTIGQEAFVPDYPKFEAGEYWIMFGEEVAVPVSGSYGYLYTAKANKSDDGKLTSTADNIFKFTAVEGGFNIQDANGMYYYMKGTYDSFNVDASPVDGSVWTVQQTGDITFKLVNASNGKVMQYDPAYSSAGAYSSDRSGAIYPNLVNTAGNEIAEVLFAVEPTEVEIEKEAGVFNINMTCKNDGFEVKPNASWITLKGMTSTNGEYVVTFAYEANEGGARTATIDFISGEETITVEVTQLGGIADVTVAEFLAAEVGEAQYRVTGILTKVAKAEYGNIYIKDATGELYVYGVGAKGEFEPLGLKVGDIVTLVGKRADYKGSPQMGGGQYVSHKPVTTVKAADVAALADDDKANPANYIMLTGKVTKPATAKFDIETYGNFDLVDESGSIYVYGVSTGWNGETKKFSTLGVKENDTITIVAYKTSYNGNAQVVGMYVSHEAAPAGDDNTGAEGGDDNTGTEGGETAGAYTMISKTADLVAGTYYMAGYITTYENQGTVYDWSEYPYHVCTGVSSDLYTSTYSFAGGDLTKNPAEDYEATDVVLEAVDGKTAAFYVKIKGAYLYSTEYNNRKLSTSDNKVEWVATDNANGGITLTTTLDAGTISLGTAGATSKMIRSYKNESTLKYGLVFFKKN